MVQKFTSSSILDDNGAEKCFVLKNELVWFNKNSNEGKKFQIL